MKKLAMAATLAAAFVATTANAEEIRARLIGYQEVPSVSTVASGEFKGHISPDDKFIDWELTYAGLQAPVTQAHIHVGQRAVIGSIVIWLCQTSINPAPAAVSSLTQNCPTSGTISGRITAANVIAGSTASQQLTANDLDEILAAIRAGVAYANVHTTISPGGEVRGQLRGGRPAPGAGPGPGK
jgi:CHRD domain-containing protein